MSKTPIDVRDVNKKELLILWSDETRQLIPYAQLRFLCPCAQCVHELTGKRMIKKEDINPDIEGLLIKPVGNYGVKIHFSDGHQTGIYSFDYLSEM